ncbi:MAG: hypothetical protein HFE79_13395 [Ruminiclostridium sp.]|nr:hypothetical protein [Ruminiclostridium sp.]
MAKNYTFKESKVVSKKMVGTYNAEIAVIEVDGEPKNLIDELKTFDGEFVELTVKTKEENDLDFDSDDK